MADYLLDLLDLSSPYLPRAVSAPLYTLVNQLPSSIAQVVENPSSFLPLLVTLFSVYLALNQFVSTVKWGVRTCVSLAKLGAVATSVAAVYSAYRGFGTEQGVSGGVRNAYSQVERVGRQAWNVGETATKWYFRDGFATSKNTRAGRRTARSTNKGTNRNKRMWTADDPDEVDLGKATTEEFVKRAVDQAKGVWGIFNSGATTGDNKRRSKQGPGANEGGGGFVWNLLANQAKKVWDDTVEGMDAPGAKAKKRTSRR